MKILALVASQDSTVEDVKTNGRRQMQALIGKDKEVLFCEYSTIETVSYTHLTLPTKLEV